MEADDDPYKISYNEEGNEKCLQKINRNRENTEGPLQDCKMLECFHLFPLGYHSQHPRSNPCYTDQGLLTRYWEI